MLSSERMEVSDGEAVIGAAKRLRNLPFTRWANRASRGRILITCACALFMVSAVMADDEGDEQWSPAVAPFGYTTLAKGDPYTHAHTHPHARALAVRQVPSPPSPTGILQLFRVSSAVQNRDLDPTSHLLDDRQFPVPGLQSTKPSGPVAVSSMLEEAGNLGGWRIRRRGTLEPTSPLPTTTAPTAATIVTPHNILKPMDIYIESEDKIQAVTRRVQPVAGVSADNSVSDVYIATDKQVWRASEGVQSEWTPVSDWMPVPGTRAARRGPAAGTLPGGLEWARSRLMAGRPGPVLTFASRRHDVEDGDTDNTTKPASQTTEATLSSTSAVPTTEPATERPVTRIVDEDNEVEDGKKNKKDENRETTFNETTKAEKEAGGKEDSQHWLSGRERYELCLQQLQNDLHLSEEAAADPRLPAPPLRPAEEAHAQRRLIRCVAEQLVAAVRELVQRFERHLARAPTAPEQQGRSNKQGGLGGLGAGVGGGDDAHGHRRKKKKKEEEELKVPAILIVPLVIQMLVVPPMLFMLGTSAIQALVSGKLALLLTIGRWLMLRMTRSDHDVYNEGLASEHYGYGGMNDPLGTEFGAWVNGW